MTNSYFLSILVHSAILVAALMVTPPLIEKLKENELTIELIESDPVALSSPSLVPAPAPAQSSATVHPLKNSPSVIDEPAPALAAAPVRAVLDDQIKAPTKTSPRSRAKVARSKTTTGRPRHAPVVKTAQAAPSRAGVPETLDDIAAPDLDFEGVSVAQTGSLGEDEFEEEFKNIDRKSEAALSAQKSTFDNEIKMVADETENELAGLENDEREKARVMSASLAATRLRNAATLSKIKAGEAAAAAAQKTARGSQIRNLENLRQRAGNPKPRYSVEERYRKEQGTVVFQAFVTPEGELKDFKLVQSTGFKNLDGKTLKALKKWKFYPGQQGWVEIPQTWNLKGEAVEMPASLRRQVSQR